MKSKEIVKYCIDSLLKAGAEKAQCQLTDSEKKELNIEVNKITLFRTTLNAKLTLTAILENKKGTTVINKTDKESINEAIKNVIEMAKSSEPDEANDIAEKQNRFHGCAPD